MKKQNLGQKTYLIVQNPFPSIENYKNSRTFEKFKNTLSHQDQTESDVDQPES